MSSSLFHCYSTGTLIDSNIIISVWDFCSVLFLLTEAKSFCLHLSWQKNPTKKKKETGEQFSGDWNVLKQWRTLEGGKWRKVRTCVCVCVDAVQISGFCQIDSPRCCDDCGADLTLTTRCTTEVRRLFTLHSFVPKLVIKRLKIYTHIVLWSIDTEGNKTLNHRRWDLKVLTTSEQTVLANLPPVNSIFYWLL